MSLFDDLLKETGNEYAGLVEEGLDSDVTGYIDTGSYALNALFSGSIYGGLVNNKVTALAGEPSTGKTFFALSIVKQYLIDNPDGAVFYFESESAITKEMLMERGIDVSRVYLIPVVTVQEFRTQAIKIINKYTETKESLRKPLFFVLDSLGSLSTDKELLDISEGKDTRDMTRAQLIRGAFRALTLKLGRAKIALLVTNHVYNSIGYITQKVLGGGEGLRYAASTIAMLNKKKESVENVHVGNIVTVNLAKSRLTVEGKKVETLLYFDKGLDKYYGLLELAEKCGIFKKVSTRYELEDGTKTFGKTIIENPEKYFTKEILDKIDEFCKEDFLYGSAKHEEEELEND